MKSRMKCAVVDDMQEDLGEIQNAFHEITDHTENLFDIRIFRNECDELYAEQFDFVILDIDLGAVSGFEVAKKISRRTPDTVVMFCTMHDDLVYEAFDCNVFYFIRKSNLKNDLIKALSKYMETFGAGLKSYRLEYNGVIKEISVKDIIYFEFLRNDMYIVLNSGKTFRDRKPMKNIVEELPDELFVPVSREYLLNLSYVSHIDKNSFVLRSGQKIPFSARKAKEMKSVYLRWMAKYGI